MRPSLSSRIFDYTNLAFWIGLVVTMYVLVALMNLSAKNTTLRNKADAIEEDNLQLESQISDLKAQVAYYGTDEYKERLAREKLGLQAPGEQVVIVGAGNAERSVDADTKAPTTTELPSQSHLEEWAAFLFGSASST